MIMKKILIFIDWFFPGYKAGGPIQSISNLINQFKNEYQFDIITSDHDLNEKPYNNIQFNQWIEKDGYRIIYLDKKHQSISFYKRIVNTKDYSLIYFNNLFSLRFTLIPLILFKKCVPLTILAPRGMLGAGALHIKTIKKKTFLFLCKILGIFRNITWHATSENECEEIKIHFGENTNIRVAFNVPSSISYNFIQRKKESSKLKLFFLSRISKKKNLLYALNILNKIEKKFNIEFYIIGPIGEGKIWNECQKFMSELNNNIKVIYLGPIPFYKLNEYLRGYHFFFLPTLHENYGHVIVESLSAGCPVIISDQTPWHFTPPFSPNKTLPPTPLLEERGVRGEVGWDLPLNKPEEFVKVIEYCAAMGQEEYDRMNRNAFEYAQSIINNPETIEANRRLFS